MKGGQVLVTDKFAPHPGGSAVLLSNWSRFWPSDQFEVIAARTPGQEAFDAAQPYPIRRVGYPDIPKLRMPWLWAGMAARLSHRCLTRRPSVVQFGQLVGPAALAPWLAVPYCLHLHGEELSMGLQRPAYRRLFGWVLRHAAGATANSRFTLERLLEDYGYSGPTLQVHPGVDSDFFSPAPARPRAGPVLLTVARLMRRKGHDLVLEVLPRLLSRYPELVYRIVGEGPERDRLEAQIRSNGLSRHVHLLGKLSQTELLQAYRSSDVFVHPNRRLESGDVEGFGIVFLEAAACGLPVIGGRSGGAQEAVADGRTGFLVGGDSAEELASRLEELLSDPGLAQRMGRAGREWACDFAWPAAARKVWEFTASLA